MFQVRKSSVDKLNGETQLEFQFVNILTLDGVLKVA